MKLPRTFPLLLVGSLLESYQCFQPAQQCAKQQTALHMFFASEDSPPTKGESSSAATRMEVDLVTSDNENFLNMVGSFLVNSFWLNSEHHQIGDTSTITEDARLGLVVEQCSDLQERYGEVMGKRLMDACVIAGLSPESKEMVGVATLKSTLMKETHVLESEKAEAIAKNAVADLGPKERRNYKDATVETIASKLLPDDTKAICILSNLAVSPSARRQGVAKTICDECEGVASDWGFDEIHLVVEKENKAARTLYEGRLGYTVIAEHENEEALRAEIQEGSFTEVSVSTLVLSKKL